MRPLRIALTKGRLEKDTVALFGMILIIVRKPDIGPAGGTAGQLRNGDIPFDQHCMHSSEKTYIICKITYSIIRNSQNVNIYILKWGFDRNFWKNFPVKPEKTGSSYAKS